MQIYKNNENVSKLLQYAQFCMLYPTNNYAIKLNINCFTGVLFL